VFVMNRHVERVFDPSGNEKLGGGSWRGRHDVRFDRIPDSRQTARHVRKVLPAQLVDATQALNLSAGVSNAKVLRGRSFS
jgi:hypothetical protein